MLLNDLLLHDEQWSLTQDQAAFIHSEQWKYAETGNIRKSV